MKKIGVILIDNDRRLRESITDLIEQQPDFKMLAAFNKSEKALAKVADLKPDVVLLDRAIPYQTSIKIVKSMIKRYPEIKVIAMDLNPLQKEILEYIEAGVSGFTLKDASNDEFYKTIRSVANDEKILPSKLTGPLFSVIAHYGIKLYGSSKLIKSVRMTRQEREIVLLIADGLTNKEIAQTLRLSDYKVKNHVNNILEKMAQNNQVKIAIYSPPDEEIKTTASTKSP